MKPFNVKEFFLRPDAGVGAGLRRWVSAVVSDGLSDVGQFKHVPEVIHVNIGAGLAASLLCLVVTVDIPDVYTMPIAQIVYQGHR